MIIGCRSSSENRSIDEYSKYLQKYDEVFMMEVKRDRRDFRNNIEQGAWDYAYIVQGTVQREIDVRMIAEIAIRMGLKDKVYIEVNAKSLRPADNNDDKSNQNCLDDMPDTLMEISELLYERQYENVTLARIEMPEYARIRERKKSDCRVGREDYMIVGSVRSLQYLHELITLSSHSGGQVSS